MSGAAAMDATAAAIARRIRLAREGHEASLEALLASCGNYLRLVTTATLDPALCGTADASDVVGEALRRASRSFHEFRGTTEAEWLGWLRGILARSAADLERRSRTSGRRRARERAPDAALARSCEGPRDVAIAPGPPTGPGPRASDSAVRFADVLTRLDADDQLVVVLRNLLGQGWDAIGRRMGRTPEDARALWTRALQRLGRAIDPPRGRP